MAGLDEVRTLWLLGSNPHTRQRSRSPSPTTPVPTLAGIDTNLSPAQQVSIADAALRKTARQTHLPSRGPYYQRERMARAVYGYPPFGTNADADQLSDEEVIIEQRKDEQMNFGYRHYVQIGRARTAFEEELSNEEEDYAPNQSAADASRNSAGGTAARWRTRRGRQTGNTTNTSAGAGEDAPIGGAAGGAGAGGGNAGNGVGSDSDDDGVQRVQPATVAAAQRSAAAMAAAAAAAAAAASQDSMEEDSGMQQGVDLDADIEDLD
ncbi:hypothetical protein OC835_006217 [Tilletia horrida]|nr:hypothetical protein OC835_006217 [Tilletia horrida]KAK0562445.1 hypothetical protein OC844_002698 [Tilletia horrida]